MAEGTRQPRPQQCPRTFGATRRRAQPALLMMLTLYNVQIAHSKVKDGSPHEAFAAAQRLQGLACCSQPTRQQSWAILRMHGQQESFILKNCLARGVNPIELRQPGLPGLVAEPHRPFASGGLPACVEEIVQEEYGAVRTRATTL